MWHTFWITAGGLLAAFAALVVAVLVFRNNSDAAKLIPAVLGVLFTVIGTILGHLQGGAAGRADASNARDDARTGACI